MVCACAAIFSASTSPCRGTEISRGNAGVRSKSCTDNSTRSGTGYARTDFPGNSRSVSTSTSHHAQPASRACISQYNSASMSPANFPPAGTRRHVAIMVLPVRLCFFNHASSRVRSASLRNQSSRSSTVGVSRHAARTCWAISTAVGPATTAHTRPVLVPNSPKGFKAPRMLLKIKLVACRIKLVKQPRPTH